MRLKLGFNEGGPSVAASTVESVLSGTGGFALDFADTSRMWTTSAKTTLVSAASDPIGAIRSKWGAAEYDFLQSSEVSRPSWNGSNAADGDGGDFLESSDALGLLNGKSAAFWCGRILPDAVASSRGVFHVAGGTSATETRFMMEITATGAITVRVRRTDGIGLGTFSSSAGVIVAGVPCVLTFDFDVAGTRAVRVFKNGDQVIAASYTPAAGNFSATNSGGFFVGKANGIGSPFDGRISRMVFGDKVFTAGEIASIEAWVGQGALT